MKDEYIIIRRSNIEKRIEELENYTYSTNRNIYLEGRNEGELSCLLNLLSESSSLIQEIEKTFNLEEDL